MPLLILAASLQPDPAPLRAGFSAFRQIRASGKLPTLFHQEEISACQHVTRAANAREDDVACTNCRSTEITSTPPPAKQQQFEYDSDGKVFCLNDGKQPSRSRSRALPTLWSGFCRQVAAETLHLRAQATAYWDAKLRRSYRPHFEYDIACSLIAGHKSGALDCLRDREKDCAMRSGEA